MYMEKLLNANYVSFIIVHAWTTTLAAAFVAYKLQLAKREYVHEMLLGLARSVRWLVFFLRFRLIKLNSIEI